MIFGLKQRDDTCEITITYPQDSLKVEIFKSYSYISQ